MRLMSLRVTTLATRCARDARVLRACQLGDSKLIRKRSLDRGACSYDDVVMASPSRDRQKVRSVTAVRLPPDLHDRLRVAAEERDLSVNYLVTKAVEEFLERLIPAEELRLTRDPVARSA